MLDLRVASFNVRSGWAFDGSHSWPFRRHAVLAVIESLDADVVGLQEVHGCQFRWLRRRLPAYDAVWVGRGANGRGEGCPLFVRRRFGRIVDHATVWFGDGPQRPGLRLPGASSPRIATTCRIEIAASDIALEVANTHLDQRSAERRLRSVAQLVAMLNPSVPQIVMGDLNAEPASELLDDLARSGLRSALPEDAGGTMHHFTSRTDGRRIDHILVDAHFEVLGAEVHVQPKGHRPASDHWPVAATLHGPTTGGGA